VEPSLEAGAPPSVAQQAKAEAQLAEDDRIDRDFTLVVPQSFDPSGVGRPLGRMTDISTELPVPQAFEGGQRYPTSVAA